MDGESYDRDGVVAGGGCGAPKGFDFQMGDSRAYLNNDENVQAERESQIFESERGYSLQQVPEVFWAGGFWNMGRGWASHSTGRQAERMGDGAGMGGFGGRLFCNVWK